MNKKALNALYTTQFLSAFADNMILFIVLAYIQKGGFENLDSYISLVQASFLLAYVILAPIVGAFADKNPKSLVLLYGNLIKALGMILLMVGVNPILSYGLVGVGAVIYSPAKYGLLPELTDDRKNLHKANSFMEAFTILSIIVGTAVGGALSDYSLTIAMVGTVIMYGLSILTAFFIPKIEGDSTIKYGNSIKEFFIDFKKLFKDPKANFALVGTASFWMSYSVLRLSILIWIPLALGITSNTHISLMVASTGIGIVLGSLLTPKIISANKFYNAYIFGLAMVAIIWLILLMNVTWLVVIGLLTIGFMSGVYVVPMNTTVQDVGQKTVGNGKTIAIQNFINNIAMLSGVLVFSYVTKIGVNVSISMFFIGFTLLLAVLYLIFRIKFIKSLGNK